MPRSRNIFTTDVRMVDPNDAIRAVLCIAVLACALATPGRDVRAMQPAHPIRPESRIWVTGASNIRRFTCNAREIAGRIELHGAATKSSILTGENTSNQPSLSIRVDKLDCGIGIMNQHLRDALQVARHPRIEFHLTSYGVELAPAVPRARIEGTVTIAGVQRPVATTGSIVADTLGRVHIRGVYLVRPTDFGVKPPRRFAGLLRVRDRAAVHFDVVLDPDDATVSCIGQHVVESTSRP